MDTAVRTLPMRTQPIESEALDSWLEATSHRLSSTGAISPKRSGYQTPPAPPPHA